MSTVLDLYRSSKGEPKSKGSGSRGRELCGPCPGCGGNDRFVIWPEKGPHGEYMCRKCGCAGDGPQYLIDFEGLSFPEACRRLGMEIAPKAPATPTAPRAQAAQRSEPRLVTDHASDIWIGKVSAFVEDAHTALLANQEQLAWLAARGISRESVIRHRLGWNGKDVYRQRKDWGLAEKLKDDGTPAKLWVPKGHVIPAYVDGVLRRVRVRKWEVRKGDPSDHRYYVIPTNPPGAGMDTWISRLDATVYVVVEAELDAILVEQAAGDLAGVVALGSSSTKPDARTSEALARAAMILVALDYDDAGAQAYWASPKSSPWVPGWWPRNYPQSERWMVPMGKDPGDYVRDHGGCVRSWVCAGLPPVMTVGLTPSGQLETGEGGEKKDGSEAWREFVRRNGGHLRLVRYDDGTGLDVDVDYRPWVSVEATMEAAGLVEALGGFDAAVSLGLVEDVDVSALWRMAD